MTSLQSALWKARNELRETAPLIHCITNPIAIHDCANAVLAVGAKPIMAEHPLEVEEITRSAAALGVNLGNITDARLASIEKSCAAAKDAGIPFALDAVGVTCSALRLEFAEKLLRQTCPTVVKGNGAEIRALAGAHFESRGIDDLGASAAETARIAEELAGKLGCIVLATGPVDTVTDGTRTALCENGTPKLALLTGTGCIVHALTSCYLAAADPFTASVLAVTTLGICGETASRDFRGLGSFHTALFDALSTLSDGDLLRAARITEKGVFHAV